MSIAFYNFSRLRRCDVLVFLNSLSFDSLALTFTYVYLYLPDIYNEIFFIFFVLDVFSVYVCIKRVPSLVNVLLRWNIQWLGKLINCRPGEN